jgi:predicted ATPase
VGKSTLVDAFLHKANAESPIWIVRCACGDPGGDVEPLQPLLESLATMCRDAPGNLGGPSEGAQGRDSRASTTDNRLLELSDGIEALSQLRPLVLVVDELQQADLSTIDLVASLGRCRKPSRVLIVATLRAGPLTRAQRLTRMIGDLLAHGRAVSIALAGFDERAVGEYLATRFGVHRFPAALATTVHAMTGGNPRLIASLFDDLDKGGLLRRDDEREATAHDPLM